MLQDVVDSVEIKDVKIGKLYKIIDEIGQGASGDVYKAESKTDGKIYALKNIKKCSVVERERVVMEVGLQRKVECDYIVKCLDVLQQKQDIVIVLEYMPEGTLHNLTKGE